MVNQLIIDILIQINNLTHNLGVSIILFTLALKLILFPITQKSIQSAQKLKELAPQLKEIQKKHAKNPKKLQAAQLELYRQHKINPILGCLPQLLQIVVLIVLYRALINFFNQLGADSNGLSLGFLWLDVSKPDKTFILPVLVGLSQLGLSWLMTLGDKKKHSPTSKPANTSKKDTSSSTADAMEQMQKQMLFLMPVITIFIAVSLPSGLMLYWLFSTLFSLFQQVFVMRDIIKKRYNI